MASLLPTCSTFLDGVGLLTNALSDLATVIDGRDCGEEKLAKSGVRQDLYSTLNAPGLPVRLLFSNLSATDLALGTQERLCAAIKRTADATTPGAILLTSGSAVQLTGEYHDVAAVRMSAELGIPMSAFAAHCFSGDHLDGYAAALTSLVRLLDLHPGRSEHGAIGVVGMPFDRNEADAHCNVAELRRLVAGMGCHLVCVVPAGQTVNECKELERASTIVALPYGVEAAALAAERLKVPLVHLPLPVGIDGTASWLRSLAGVAGASHTAEAFIDAELSVLVPKLRRVVRELFAGARLLLAADPHMAHSLLPALTELGFRIDALLLRSRNAPLLYQTVEHIRNQAEHVLVNWDLSVPDLHAQWQRQVAEGSQLIIATSSERAAAMDLPVPFLELGFPCYVRHALFDAPWMGFKGLLWLADRLFNLLSEQRFMRG